MLLSMEEKFALYGLLEIVGRDLHLEFMVILVRKIIFSDL